MGKKNKKTGDAGKLIRHNNTSDTHAPFSPQSLANNSCASASKAPTFGKAPTVGVHIACLVFLIVIIYSNTLNAPFQLDESLHLVGNPLVTDLRYILHPSEGQWSEQYKFFVDRYVAFITFALNYRIHGLSVAGYHIVNIAIHIANSILVYLLVLLTFRTPFFKPVNGKEVKGEESDSQPLNYSRFTIHDSRPLIAFFSAALFAVHPLQTEAVTYVMQRFASLVAFFYLLSLVAYIHSRQKAVNSGWVNGESKTKKYSLSILAWYFLSLFFAVCAMKTKENAFTLPIVIVLYEFCFFSPSPRVPASPHLRVSLPSPHVSQSLRRRVLLSPRLHYLVPILLTLLIIPLTHMSLGASSQIDPGLYGHIYPQPEYLLTEFRVVVTCLRLLFLPINQNLDYDYPVFHSFFDPQVIASFLFLSALFGLGVYMIIGNRQWAIGNGIKAKDKEDDSRFTIHYSLPFRLIGFGILWFFITISVESSIIPLWMLICEYRAYLPSVGLIISVVTGAFMLKERVQSPKAGKVVLALFVLTVGVLSVATYLRNETWGNRARLWEDTAKKSPAKARVHFVLGCDYFDEKKYDRAIEQYEIALRLDPDSDLAHNNLGNAFRMKGWTDKAIEQYEIALKLNPQLIDAHNNLGLALLRTSRQEEGIREINTAYAIEHYNTGNNYLKRGYFDFAISEFQAALRLNPDYPEAHFKLGDLYYKMGQVENARREVAAGLNVKPEPAMHLPQPQPQP